MARFTTEQLGEAFVYAIAEDVLNALEWDNDLERWILPSGFVFSMEAQHALLASKALDAHINKHNQDGE